MPALVDEVATIGGEEECRKLFDGPSREARKEIPRTGNFCFKTLRSETSSLHVFGRATPACLKRAVLYIKEYASGPYGTPMW